MHLRTPAKKKGLSQSQLDAMRFLRYGKNRKVPLTNGKSGMSGINRNTAFSLYELGLVNIYEKDRVEDGKWFVDEFVSLAPIARQLINM